MNKNLWIAYTPYDGVETFPTEEKAQEYVKKILCDDDGFWIEEYLEGSWIGKITKKVKLKITDRKEDHKCQFQDRECSYRDDEGICIEELPLDPDNPVYNTVLGCKNPNFWPYNSEEIGSFSELNFVNIENE